jgi:hypothetical protein
MLSIATPRPPSARSLEPYYRQRLVIRVRATREGYRSSAPVKAVRQDRIHDAVRLWLPTWALDPTRRGRHHPVRACGQ